MRCHLQIVSLCVKDSSQINVNNTSMLRYVVNRNYCCFTALRRNTYVSFYLEACVKENRWFSAAN